MALWWSVIVSSLVAAVPAEAPAAPIDYSREVRPILANYCFACHGPDAKARQAELRLDQSEGAIRELPSGKHAIAPGAVDQSELLTRITSHDPDIAMPPAKFGKKPTPAEVETLRRWIAAGAKYATHWAYVAPSSPPLPAVSDTAWPRGAIDQFILARIEGERLRPSPRASDPTLLRRAALDLTGLPPTAEDIAEFAKDSAGGNFDEAWSRAVDRLLAKPTYGERWASLWLDLARYGDSSGYIHDPPRTIWRWRDWLIQALNRNLPYDQFTIEMLAGDLLPEATTEQIIATGFHRNTTMNTEGGSNSAEFHFASVVDRVNTTMQVFMGTTLACAQCHDHKYDPFTQREYYQIFAVFNNTLDFNSEDPKLETARVNCEPRFAQLAPQAAEAKRKFDEETATVDAAQAAWETAVDRATLSKELAEALALAADKRTPPQVAALQAFHRGASSTWVERDREAKRLRAELDEVSTTTLIMKEGAERPTRVAVRGEFNNWGDAVTPGVPAALHSLAPGGKLDRLALARWVVDPRNPLTARVAANRLWQEIFGVGIVESSEFGLQGELPSHAELLDWLATEYIRSGWDTKRLLKLLVTSAAYCQSSSASDELLRLDPHNRLLARGARTRLSAEAVRDQALAVSGLLAPKLFGPPAQPFQPVNGLSAAFGPSTDWATSAGEDAHRRALYTKWRRNLPYPSMIAFDVPERAVCSMRRIQTNTPVQALVTLNDPVFVEAAQALGRRIVLEGGATSESRASFALRLVLSRPATDAETRRIVTLLESTRSSLAADPNRATALATKPLGPLPEGMAVVDAAAWTVVGNVLLNLDETLSKH